MSDILLCTSSTSSTGTLQRFIIRYSYHEGERGVGSGGTGQQETMVSQTVVNGLIEPRGLGVDISGE